jgi:hypothetical protein
MSCKAVRNNPREIQDVVVSLVRTGQAAYPNYFIYKH